MRKDLVKTASGADLRREREAAGLKGFEVAAAMGVHSSRTSQIEAMARVTPETAERYRRALVAAQAAI